MRSSSCMLSYISCRQTPTGSGMQDAFSSHQTLHHARAHLGLHAGRPVAGVPSSAAGSPGFPSFPARRPCSSQYSTEPHSRHRRPPRPCSEPWRPAATASPTPTAPGVSAGRLPRPRPARLSPLRLPVHAGFLRTARSGLPQHRGPGGLPAASSRHPRNGGHAPGPTPVEASGPDVLRGPQRPYPDRACGRRG